VIPIFPERAVLPLRWLYSREVGPAMSCMLVKSSCLPWCDRLPARSAQRPKPVTLLTAHIGGTFQRRQILCENPLLHSNVH
jgi:hypothetical protein